MKKISALLLLVLLVASSVFAADTRIYCKMSQDWWKADGAAVGAHYWKDGGQGTTWPGVRMTPVDGETDLWQIDIDLSKYEKIIFIRVNGSGAIADWGAKTKDLTIPTDGKNLFTITTSSAVWGNPGCEGTWSKYDAPTPDPDPEPVDSTTVYFVDMLGWSAANAFVWPATGNAYKAWPGEAMKKTTQKVHGKDIYSYTFPSSFVNIIFNHESTQTVDLAWSEANLYFCPETADSEGKITGKWYASTEAIPAPYVVIPETMKLVPGSYWNNDGAKFAVYTWGGKAPAAWSAFFEGTGDTLHAEIDSKADSLVLVRFNSATGAPTWTDEETNIWGKIDKILIDHTSLVYTVTSYTTGTWKPVANYYATGDSALVVDGGLTEDKEWAEDAFPSFKDTLVLKNLKANQEYKLKIVAGSDWKGYSDLTSLSSGLRVDGDNNILFKLTAKGNVTVVYNDGVFKVLGSFVEEFDPNTQQYLKLVPYVWNTANAKMAAFYWGKKVDGGFSKFFTGEGDTLQTAIPIAADSMVLVRFASEVTYPSWDWEDKDNPENNKVWNKIDKILIDHKGLVYTVKNWDEGTWESFIPAKYYITGNSALVVDAGLDAKKAWDAQAFKATTDSYVISGLKAGVNYELKVCPEGILDGDHLGKGYSDLSSKPDGVKGNTDNNICFSLSKAGSVTVTYTESAFTIAGDFYVKQYENKTVKFVPSEEWLDANAKFAAFTWGAEQDGIFSDFFAPISEGNDTLSATIKTSADSIEFVRFSPKASAPTWEQKADAEVLVWNKLKDTIDWKGLTASVEGWDKLTWEPVARPCESYGLLINGVYHAGKKNVMQTEWTEYKLLRVSLKEGDKLQVRNDCADNNWVIEKYAATSYDRFKIEGGKYVVDADGIYDFYLKFIYGGDEIYISRDGYSTQAVPNQCEAVLMQAFFNESYSDYAPGVRSDADYKLGLGNTRWSTLTAQAAAISKYFDYVWLPPSANGDGMGYHPKDYGNQSSNWGSASELKTLINALHEGGAKVVADVVINHCASTYGWMGFPEFDFGKYGKFQPKGSWICSNDEVNTDPKSDSQGQATGPNDDGDNWSGARDWAHSNVDVQNMFKAYLQWLREVIGYDGFRYDKGDGFNNWHHDNYNKTALPEIAFMECYSNTDKIQWCISEANGNLMALDFDTKWHVFDGFASHKYYGRGNGLLGRGDTKHAVLFIDSHDWFLRDDNQNEFGGRGNSLTPELKDRLLQANAFLLSMPGVPCVFYPHWKKYQTEIEQMIKARKWAGIHSESPVTWEEFDDNSDGYQATMQGKYGYLILQLGNKTKHEDQAWDPDYKLMAKGNGFAMWVNRCNPVLENGYYLVGNKYNWTPVAERKLIDSSTAGEYILPGVVLTAEDSLKVVRVEKDEIIQWYPGGDNYVVDVTHEGTKTVYFRPEASDPIYIEPNHATFIEETNEMPQIKAEKFFENGKMYIRLGDKVYDVIGQTIK